MNFEWVLAMWCVVGFERLRQELPRNEEQGNAVVSLPDLLLKEGIILMVLNDA